MEVAYLAGLFDGEGCIKIQHNKGGYGLSITIQMYCKKIIYKIQESFGGSAGGPYGKNRKKYSWQVNGNDVGRILNLITPYLIEKKEQAELALDYVKTIGCGYRGRTRRTETEKTYKNYIE